MLWDYGLLLTDTWILCNWNPYTKASRTMLVRNSHNQIQHNLWLAKPDTMTRVYLFHSPQLWIFFLPFFDHCFLDRRWQRIVVSGHQVCTRHKAATPYLGPLYRLGEARYWMRTQCLYVGPRDFSWDVVVEQFMGVGYFEESFVVGLWVMARQTCSLRLY